MTNDSIADYIRVRDRGEAVLLYTFGIDNPNECLDLEHFKKYQWPFEYMFNSRGFRDREWPTDPELLKNSIWCVGDSFTLGVGSPLSHTWPTVLSSVINRPIINCSMDGASNEWIHDIVACIIEAFDPLNIAIMWSYTHRRKNSYTKKILYDRIPEWKQVYDDLRQPHWPRCDTAQRFESLPRYIKEIVLNQIDPDRYKNDLADRIHYVDSTHEDDLHNFIQCLKSLRKYQRHQIIHSSIPGFAPSPLIPVSREILEKEDFYIPYFDNLDRARDGHHFDIVTARWVSEQMSLILRDD